MLRGYEGYHLAPGHHPEDPEGLAVGDGLGVGDGSVGAEDDDEVASDVEEAEEVGDGGAGGEVHGAFLFGESVEEDADGHVRGRAAGVMGLPGREWHPGNPFRLKPQRHAC